MNKSFLAPLALLAALALGSCSKDNDSDNASKPSKLQIRMTDAPGDFRAVSLDLRRIEVHLKDEGEADGWETLSFNPQVINILEYVNGRSALLVDTDFRAGDIKEIRLILGENNSVTTKDGQTYSLKTPSGQTSGVKLKLQNVKLKERETFQLLLDFDVARSIVERGNGSNRYLLKPVIRVVALDVAGSIRGVASPAAALPQVLAIRRSITPNDTFSTRADASGAFRLYSLPGGTYTVKLFPTTAAPANETAYRTETVVSNVELPANTDKDLGTIQLR